MIPNDMSEDRLVLCIICQGKNEEAQTIFQDINPTELVYPSKNGLLHFAARFGNTIMTKCLIDLGCEIDAANDDGNTPLIFATQKNHADVIRMLIEANANIFISNAQGKSAAGIALGSAEIDHLILDMFLLKVKEKCLNDSLQTATTLLQLGCSLPRAVKLKDTAITKYMLENGCNVDAQDIDYNTKSTPLHQAVRCSDLENVKLLIDYGADVNSKDRCNREPLFFVRDKQILKTLLDFGAQPITNGVLVTSRLFVDGDEEIIEMLLQCNLDFSAKDWLKNTIFCYLLQNKKFNTTKIIKENMDDSFNVNAKNCRGNTLLANAISASNIEIVEFLLHKGATVNIVDVDGGSPLAYTLAPPKSNDIQKARTKIMMLLLEYGANVQLINSQQRSMLNYALLFKSFDMAKHIVAHIALIEDLGIVIKDSIRNQIEFHEPFKNHYDFCKTKIESMKNALVCEVSLFKLLTAKEGEITDLASNKQLVSKVQSLIDVMRNPKLHYYKVLQKNIMKIVTLAVDIQE